MKLILFFKAATLFFLFLKLGEAQITNDDKQKREQEEENFRAISKEYVEGKFLIYDCLKNHFACVDLNGHKRCLERREEKKRFRRGNLSCFSIYQGKTKDDCFSKQFHFIFYVNSNFLATFCKEAALELRHLDQ